MALITDQPLHLPQTDYPPFKRFKPNDGTGDDVYDHSIYFKGDSFTVREDKHLWVREENKHNRPVDDTTIRSVWDPRNKEFLESLMKEECPAEFSEGRQGVHYIHLYGLRDDQDLKEPSTPPHCVHLCAVVDGFMI
ncbi:hypothetical protein FRX31_022778 [Thalictrum thalictroides]|uniref:Uncharacterized protein n=1 Tax=Thalictrum thalictroides TaxID=46969 RepID=A0A7J6VSD3_THATH|nr:hypothetical protein FRX31_022778 [Thalictrum thalictroides]